MHEHAAFVIEVSTSAEHMVGPLAIGTFLGNRLGENAGRSIHSLTRAEIVATLAEARRHLGGRPVVWVSYAAPLRPDLIAKQKKVADALRIIAERLGDALVDAYSEMRSFGQERIFKDWRKRYRSLLGLGHWPPG
ncbi:hypothetical protein ACG873_15180 [Mesorhizobium sp. AaZ16]|uniref:hypothetical protein n=1 Tax=Mesorhizobium sp. AaZ16 TaxID=3402289 RepID=UPI00374F0C6C